MSNIREKTMSYQDTGAAIHGEMHSGIPRTEYSAESHWKLVEKVTGIPVNEKSSDEVRGNASRAFMKAWDYGYIWNTLIHAEELDKCRTRMGHAVYATGGVDFDRRIECPFEDVEDVLEFDAVEIYGIHPHAQLVERFNKNYRERQEWFSDAVNVTGTYITLISGLLEIFGWE